MIALCLIKSVVKQNFKFKKEKKSKIWATINCNFKTVAKCDTEIIFFITIFGIKYQMPPYYEAMRNELISFNLMILSQLHDMTPHSFIGKGNEFLRKATVLGESEIGYTFISKIHDIQYLSSLNIGVPRKSKASITIEIEKELINPPQFRNIASLYALNTYVFWNLVTKNLKIAQLLAFLTIYCIMQKSDEPLANDIFANKIDDAVDLSLTFQPKIKTYLLQALRTYDKREYLTILLDYLFKTVQIQRTTGLNDRFIFFSFFRPLNNDYSSLSNKEIQFFGKAIASKKIHPKDLRMEGEYSTSTVTKYLTRLGGSNFLSLRSCYNLENLKLDNYYLILITKTQENLEFVEKFSLLRSYQKINSMYTTHIINFFYHNDVNKVKRWIDKEINDPCNQKFLIDILLIRVDQHHMYFSPTLYDPISNDWGSLQSSSQAVDIIESGTPLEAVTEDHYRIAFEMMKGPYKKSKIAYSFQKSRNYVYSIMKELEETKTVYLRYVMVMHYSLTPLFAIVPIANSKQEQTLTKSYFSRQPYSIIYRGENLITGERMAIAFLGLPPKQVNGFLKALQENFPNAKWLLAPGLYGTYPKFSYQFKKGNLKLRPLPTLFINS